MTENENPRLLAHSKQDSEKLVEASAIVLREVWQCVAADCFLSCFFFLGASAMSYPNATADVHPRGRAQRGRRGANTQAASGISPYLSSMGVATSPSAVFALSCRVLTTMRSPPGRYTEDDDRRRRRLLRDHAQRRRAVSGGRQRPSQKEGTPRRATDAVLLVRGYIAE
mmetsp:Transcript_23274/g.92316  ORF Transcript_23274/g.92316 Transcript_23274/m.92316 type:complete len:169 (+) Transcript_23274:872-1378(+)